MDFKQNYFELFGLPVGFELDESLLKQAFHKLQSAVHPDKHAGASEHDRRLSLQYATHINEGYEVLKKPVSRAIYLMLLKGVDVAANENPELDPIFLMEQISLREELDDLADDEDLDGLVAYKTKVNQVIEELEQDFGAAYQSEQLEQAETSIHHIQFMLKLYQAADHKEEQLLDY